MANIQKEIDIVKVISVVVFNKRKIGFVTFISTFLVCIYCIFATPIYTSSALINPPKITDAGTSFSQVISGLTSSNSNFFSQKTDADIMIAIMKTNAIKDMVIKRFDLTKVFSVSDIELTRQELSKRVYFVSDLKSGFVSINVDSNNPKLAMQIANYYTVALGQLINNIAYARADQKYKFYQEQLKSASAALSNSESALRLFSESNGVIAGQQTQVLTNLSAQLQGQLVVSQIKLKEMSYYANNDNPDYKALQSKISSIKSQLLQLSSQDPNDNLVVPAGLAPKLSTQYIGLVRDVKFKQLVYEVMLKQSKAAQLDAQSEITPMVIQVIDPAQVPIYKSKPKRLKLIVGGFLGGLLCSMMYFIFINRRLVYREI